MNNVVITVQGIELPIWTEKARSFVKKVLKEIQKDNWDLSILFCDDKTIKKLNSQYRNKNEPTDILSFNLGETVKHGKKTIFFPGDIVISLDSMKKNAEFYKITCDEELRRLVIHGILHLDNMNHETNNETEPMLVLQEEILARLGRQRIIGGLN